MSNITFQYRSKKKKANLEARLTFKVDGKRKSQYAKTNIEISKKYWDEYREGINFKDVDKANLKTDIEEEIRKIRKFVLPQFEQVEEIKKGWLKSVLHEYYHPKKEIVIPDNLLSYLEYYLDKKSNEILPKSVHFQKWMQIKLKIELLEDSTGKEYIIKDVNEDFKKEYEDCLLSYDYSPTTIKKSFNFIKTLCFHAETKDIEISKELHKLSVKIEEKKKPKIYLSFNELDKIRALNNLPEYLDNARDWLLISCYTGQRISDFMRFNSSMIRESKGKKFIDLTQQKTGKDVTVPLISDVIEVLNKRDGEFPRRISDQRYNDYIKEVCKRAGINKKMYGKKQKGIEINGKQVNRAIAGTYEKWKLIGSHVGRRSFATNYYGILPTSFIKDRTGHSTEEMLLRYIGKTSKDTAVESYDLMEQAKK